MVDRPDPNISPAEEADPEATAREPVAAVKRQEVISYLEPGETVGRYVVVDRLGEGGMGVVYSAHDPELDRKVALKLMHAQSGGSQSVGEQAMLLREAQALARLAHPNVVAVHDVGTQHGQRLFVAMELVDGVTLRAWLKAKERTWSDVLPILIAAGTGLAAAHAADLVHRDFKPDNVIVGKDGRVRVMDFGLARLHRPGEQPVASRGSDSYIEIKSPLTDSLTVAGSLVGTPAYMAPELYDGHPADKLTDQFAFGVTLFEALFRKRPYTREQLTPPRKPTLEPRQPGDTKVPARIQRAVLRAISIDPTKRFPSIDALLAELAFDPHAKRRRLLVGGALMATALASLGTVYMLSGKGEETRCSGAPAKLAGVWDSNVRTRIMLAFAKTGRGHATTTATRVASLFDDYAKTWVADQTASCQATLRGEQTERLADLRSACMQQHLNQLGALSTLFAGTPSAEVVDHAIAATVSLPPIEHCRDEAALVAKVAPPTDPLVRGRVDALRKRIDHITALTRAGAFAEGLEQAESINAEARSVPYLPVRGEAFLILARAYEDAGKSANATALLRDVLLIAGEVHDDGQFTSALLGLMKQSGRIPGRLPEVIALAPVARGVIARLGNPDERLSDLELQLATAYSRTGKYEEAIAHTEAALAHAQKNPDDKLQLGAIHTTYSATLEAQGRYPEAREKALRALELIEQVLGKEHPDLAPPLNNIANVAMRMGNFDEAEALHRRGLAIIEKSISPEHPQVATTLNNLGIVFQERGDYRQARAYYQQAFELSRKLLRDDDPMIGVGYNNIGEVVLLAGNPEEAIDYYDRAVETWQKVLPAEHPMFGYALTGKGKALLAERRPSDALVPLERALAIRESGGDPILLAETRFALARAFWELGQRKRSLELARQSLAAYQAGGGAVAKPLQEIEQWLAAHAR